LSQKVIPTPWRDKFSPKMSEPSESSQQDVNDEIVDMDLDSVSSAGAVAVGM
jgi:hypothetical protein